MFIYNITLKVNYSVHDEWLQWLKAHHIPTIMKCGCFTKFQLLKLCNINESDGATYALQFYADSKADYSRYIELYMAKTASIEQRFWGMNVVSFATLMEIVN